MSHICFKARNLHALSINVCIVNVELHVSHLIMGCEYVVMVYMYFTCMNIIASAVRYVCQCEIEQRGRKAVGGGRADLLGGDTTSPLGGSGDMLPRKSLKNRCSETHSKLF